MYEKILLATDGSDDALRAAGRVIELQKKYGSKVVIFHSIEHHMLQKTIPLGVAFGSANHYTVPTVDYNKIRAEYEREGKAIIEKTKSMFNGEFGPVETRLIKDEEPEDYIKRTVKEEDFDLVALGCKGNHSKLKRIFLGTVATKVLNEAPCDVLVVR
ncbi:MAG: universal stress protein [Promethearchaeota archaeon]|nr:MAG: universal stress protein [Candidatus Lokiarchaeota archaeon]